MGKTILLIRKPFLRCGFINYIEMCLGPRARVRRVSLMFGLLIEFINEPDFGFITNSLKQLTLRHDLMKGGVFLVLKE